MTAFNQAFALLKESASKDEYRANPENAPGGFGAQDFDLGTGNRGKRSGVAHLMPDYSWRAWNADHVPNRLKAHSSSRVFPYVPKRWEKDWGEDNLQGTNFEMQMADWISRIGAHEAGHQALHGINPNLIQGAKKDGGLAHEMGAFQSEYAAMRGAFPLIREKYKAALRHPALTDDAKMQIQQILDDLKITDPPDIHAQVMGQRAQANAKEQMRMIERAEYLDKEIDRLNSLMMNLDYESNSYFDTSRELYEEADVLERELEELNRRIAKADILKAPLYYPDEDWGDMGDSDSDGPSSREKENFPDYMSDLMAPAGFSDVSWQSEDGLARGVAQLNFDTGQVNVHHFEVATPVRNSGLGESYLREMIDEIEQDFIGQNTLEQFHAHATRVEPKVSGFWDKMVDRGVIHSASSRSNPRVTVDGKHFAPKISSDKLQPWEWLTEDDI